MGSGEFDQEKRIEINLMSEVKVTPKNLRLYEVCIFVTLDFFFLRLVAKKKEQNCEDREIEALLLD